MANVQLPAPFGANEQSGLRGLLADPVFNLGVGLLGAGLSQPRNLGQGLLGGFQAGGQLQSRASQNQVLREQMTQQARQRQAQTQLGELMSSGQFGTGQEHLGLLAQASPDAFTQSLMGQVFPQQRADTSLVRNLQAAGIDPMSAEGQEIIRQNLTGGNIDELLKTIQAQQAQLNTQLAQERLTQQRRARQASVRTERQERLESENAVFRGIRNIDELSTLVDRLEGTFLEPGGGADELRRAGLGAAAFLGERLGFDTQEQQRLAADLDRFRQLATGAGLENLEILRGTGAISDQKFQTLLKTFTDPTASPDAIRRALADAMEAQLDAAGKLDLDLPNRDEIEAQMQRLRGEQPSRRHQERRASSRRNQRPGKPQPVDLGNGMTLEFID
jgi:ribosomal protein L12E/L44/L45/RPP1/RPP2